MKTFHRARLELLLAAGGAAVLLAAPATLFLTIGGDRSYLPALIRRVRQSLGLQLERAA